ncbi:tripartite tricarboxylate transporter TctB family protein [Hoeflea sp. TYP-13]|uniref:tripartite tricarboxylate transporter TctB family protein n=1 Tax=Hoeflea sp. TYP-13 TaxID=3230023 RepID=UPI0034C67355
MNRTQHMVPSGIVTLVALWVCWVSYTQQPADAFLFPRLISTIFLALSLWTFGKAALGLSKVGAGVSLAMMRNLAPGFIVAGIYVFWAAKTFGFYAASTVAFLILLTIYDPAPHDSARTWIRRIVITAVYIAVIYGLFALVLKVYTPRGMFM